MREASEGPMASLWTRQVREHGAGRSLKREPTSGWGRRRGWERWADGGEWRWCSQAELLQKGQYWCTPPVLPLLQQLRPDYTNAIPLRRPNAPAPAPTQT